MEAKALMRHSIQFTVLVLFTVFSFELRAEFSARLLKETNILSILIRDEGIVPPFEAGELWKILKGPEQTKLIMEDNFDLECRGFKNSWGDVVGDCELSIPMELFQKIGETQVFKLKGPAAAKLNRYFTDSAYLNFQRAQAYLSSYNTRREFYFGIKDSLIKR